MKYLLSFFVFLQMMNEIECTAWTPQYPAIQDCQISSVANSKDFVSLLCNIRTINSEIDSTNFSIIPPLNTGELSLKCSDLLFFQSALRRRNFQHLKNLENLNILYCKIGEIPSDTFFGLSNLKNLTLKTFNSDWSAMSLTIKSGAFNGLEKLQRLDLSNNNIWTLPEKIFCDLGNLTFLNISANKLQKIDSLNFQSSHTRCVQSLRYLDISYNNFKSLPTVSFVALKNLSVLNISNNFIREIADQVFFGMFSLQHLDISHNFLSTLPPELFKENKRLTKIYARNNSINVLAPGVFIGLNLLLELDLSHNELTNTWVNSETFTDLIRLAVLDISHNKISRLDMATYRDLTNLQLLNLENNDIDSISDNTFKDLFRLHTLLLSNNNLKSLSPDTFNGLVSLTDLRLNINNISSIHSAVLLNSTRLRTLHLRNNRIQTLSFLSPKFSHLTHLDLSYNKIRIVNNNSFSGLDKLSTLHLESNFISKITKETFTHLPNLEVLNCADNGIRTIENGAFNSNLKLKAIRFDVNRIKNIHGLFSNLSTLRWLNVSRNNLELFDYAFIPMHLEYLDLSHNQINDLGNHFKVESQMNLKVIDASFNSLRVITASSIVDSVEVVLLNNNLITTIEPYTFFKKRKVVRVDLSHNKMKSINQNSLRLSSIIPGSLVPEFYLSNNLFECDCTFGWLQTINIQKDPHQTPRVVDLTSLMCFLFSKRGRTIVPLIEAQKFQFLCEYTSHCFSLCHCCDFDACDCEMSCPSGCTCFHDSSWATNIIDCSNSGLIEVPTRVPMDASKVYLDGNKLNSLSSHSFIGRKNLRVLFLNNSEIDSISNRSFSGLSKLKVLYLDSNNISMLRGYEFYNLQLLKELYLHNNFIKSINQTTFSDLTSLKVLRLDGNSLVTLPFNLFNENLLLRKLWLGQNSWSCDCSFINGLKTLLGESTFDILDKPDFYCIMNDTTGRRKNILSNEVTCGAKNFTSKYEHMISNHDYLVLPTIGLAVCAFVLSVILVIFCNRNRIRVSIYAKYGLRIFKKSETEGTEKVYDAFLSYSSKDEVFVTQILAPELENGSPSYKLSLQYRDFPLGSVINEPVAAAVEASKRVILILSENFVKSEWTRLDFRSAYHEILKDRRRRFIVILLGDIPRGELDHDLKLYVKTNTFLKWGDKRFWSKLKYAMPDARPTSRNHHQLATLSQQVSNHEPQQPQHSRQASLNQDPQQPLSHHHNYFPSLPSQITITQSNNQQHNHSHNHHYLHHYCSQVSLNSRNHVK